MPTRVPHGFHRAALRLEVLFQRLGQRYGADRIALTGGDQHPARGFGGGGLRLERDERMHQHRSIEKLGLFDQHIGKNIRAIGKTEADDRTGLIMLPVCLLYTSPSPRDS